MSETAYWKRCSSCKKEIPFNTMYYLCSVSTCKHKRKGFQFCSVPCWDAHLGFANHRDAWAEEAQSPSSAESSSPDGQTRQKKRTIVDSKKTTSTTGSTSPASPSSLGPVDVDTLVVTSRVKSFIKEQSGFNTSQCTIDVLTQKVAHECLRAIEKARAAERRTVKGRDLK